MTFHHVAGTESLQGAAGHAQVVAPAMATEVPVHAAASAGSATGPRMNLVSDGWTAQIPLRNSRIYSMREVSNNTAKVLDEINERGEPALVTKRGRFVALITPLAGVEIESMVLSGSREVRQRLQLSEARGIGSEAAPGEPVAEAARAPEARA